MNDAAIALVAALFGACFGSFLNVCIVRLPDGGSVISPSSTCPRCGRAIKWYENIPVLSWLILRGRCAGCALPISPLYPLVEIGVALVWGFVFWKYGPSLVSLRIAVLATVLIGIGVTDLRTYTIPDGFTVFGLGWVLLTTFIAAFLGDTGVFAGPYEALLGACTGAGAIAIAMWLGEWALKREAMGFGDVTLMAVAGAALGPSRALMTIFLGALIGTLVFIGILLPLSMRARGLTPAEPAVATPAEPHALPAQPPGALPLVPFGVFLAPAAIVTLLWGDTIVRWYLDFITH